MFSSNQRFSTFFLKADTALEPPHGQEKPGPCLGEADPLSPKIALFPTANPPHKHREGECQGQ